MLSSYIDMNLIVENTDTRYEGKKFEGFKNLPPSQKGKVGEAWCENVMEALGYTVESPINKNHDRIINGRKAEIKSSTLNNNTEKFSFLQIRPAQDYEYMILQAFLPGELRMFEIEKEEIKVLISEGTIKPQHGGKEGNSGTFMWYPTIEDLEKHCTEVFDNQ